ncbi:MAG TPA: hypothetical protein DCP91_11090 [Eggerthellaceae bacterium]|nr:hypothetical protein [Eggerthellaceae bacterium]
MLFVLTGNIQIGKTRWLQNLLADLEQRGVRAYGVLAPGVWEDRRNASGPRPHVDANGFEKTGIDNVLLPQEDRVAFARRRDLAERAGIVDCHAQSTRAQLGWRIADSAIDRVNAHFADLAAAASAAAASAAAAASTAKAAPAPAPGVLVVDELGKLELECGTGLVQAVAVLQSGPTPVWQHAIVVVRSVLLHAIEGQFAAWGAQVRIAPDEAARAAVFDAFALRCR